MAIPATSSLTRDDWLNIARCASRRADLAKIDGDEEREVRETNSWFDTICMVNS